MSQDDSSSKLSFKCCPRSNPRSNQALIYLNGDLDGSDYSKLVLGLLEQEIRALGPSIAIVSSHDARVFVRGAADWIDVVTALVRDMHFIYLPSQLGLILKHDSRYAQYFSHVILEEEDFPELTSVVPMSTRDPGHDHRVMVVLCAIVGGLRSVDGSGRALDTINLLRRNEEDQFVPQKERSATAAVLKEIKETLLHFGTSLDEVVRALQDGKRIEETIVSKIQEVAEAMSDLDRAHLL